MYTITDGANLSSLEQAKVNYVDFETAVTRFFKDYLRESAFLRRHPSFFLQYRLMRPFFRKLFPFMYLRKGSTVVQVGCAEWMLDFGVSMPLIMSAVVGPRGRVVVVEPDQKNVDSLTAYISRHGIRNITIVKKAAWKEKCVRGNSVPLWETRRYTGWRVGRTAPLKLISTPGRINKPQSIRHKGS